MSTPPEHQIEVDLIDYKGREYGGPFWVARDPSSGPGWYVFGRCFGDYKPIGIIKVVARPPVKPRKHPHYNSRVRRGWPRKKDALRHAQWMDRVYPP